MTLRFLFSDDIELFFQQVDSALSDKCHVLVTVVVLFDASHREGSLRA